MVIEHILTVFAALLGVIAGSFLNVVILRLPDPDQSIVFPASHCPRCSAPLHWYENIPIVSYIVLRGKCNHCCGAISPQYPVVELTMGLLAAALIAKFGLSIVFFCLFLFSGALLAIIVIDIHHQIIPDAISLPGIVAGLLFSLVSPSLSWQSSLIGIVAGGGILYAVAALYLMLRKIDGMGGGDIKLLAMIGAWLGWQSLPFVIFTSSLSGSIVGLIAMRYQKKGGRTRIPFGPFLSIAALVFMFFSETIQFYFQLYLAGQWP
ncbi:prepilin peptidase [Desulforhopalus singaporensis]|uniref:Prepilin leader peptidase/N-methyltransferase n=1 Tax=Desulforhopalus singaporensis TaxID=91360 RepID=A0A1H0NBZ0_9BACT|nr:A24 family peptidase [Desulforhopalus singaporensis]SDO89935.1 type 4 prepilin peptidase 1 Aspartic peptidase. MEROPS family A24A [Desulforhopalus singaporensis]